VKYFSGNLSGKTPDSIVKGFADPARYDTVKSPLARPGSTGSVLGPGGIVDGAQTITGAIQDLANGKGSVESVLGAVRAGGGIAEQIKGGKLKDIIKEEGSGIINGVIRNKGPAATKEIIGRADGVFFPKSSNTATTAGATANKGKPNYNFNKKPSTPRPAVEAPKGPETRKTKVDKGIWT